MKPFALMQAFTLAALLAASPVQAQKIKVGYWTSGFSLGYGAVMEQMKFAEKEGLDVEWVKFAEVSGPLRALVPQTVDLAFAAPSTASMSVAADGIRGRRRIGAPLRDGHGLGRLAAEHHARMQDSGAAKAVKQ